MKAEMRREIARQRVGEAAAEKMHAAFPVAEQTDNRRKICFGKMPERAPKIGDCRLREWIDERSLEASRPRCSRAFGERRGQLSLQFFTQLPLKIRIAEKAELGDKAKHGRWGDLSALGEFGHRGQPRRGIVRQKGLRGLALLRRQTLDRVTDVFRDGIAIVSRLRFRHAVLPAYTPTRKTLPAKRA